MIDLVDEVLGAVSNKSSRNPSWFDRLPADAQAELLRVRETFDPRAHQKRAFYLALRAAAEKRGWTIAKETQVTRWLTGEV